MQTNHGKRCDIAKLSMDTWWFRTSISSLYTLYICIWYVYDSCFKLTKASVNFIQNFSSFFTVHGLIENTCKKWESVQRNNFSCLEKVNNLFKYYIITDNISLSSCGVGMWRWIFFFAIYILKNCFRLSDLIAYNE